MSLNLKTLVIVTGPTASGKTGIAIQLAKHFNTEIISADSRQFYKEIPIGTAAPDSGHLAELKHYFIGHLSVKDEYNVSIFEKDVLRLLEAKFADMNTMVMVGGSGLYIDAVCKGIDDLPDPDPVLRDKLNLIFEKEGITALQEKLKKLDSEYYYKVDLKNPKRLMRAIEVCLQTGRPYSGQRLNQSVRRDFNIIKIGLELPRDELYDRINQRAQLMIDEGWIEEARAVYPLKSHNALNTVGYKELFRFFDGDWQLETAIEKIKVNTRRYAKRQMTWFKKDLEINWFSPNDVEHIIEFLELRLPSRSKQ